MQDFSQRLQNTIARPVQVSGFGLFGGIDVTLEFCPADPDHGIVFERVDLNGSVRIPALIEYVVPKPRCTVIAHQEASVSVIEHVMAALAGLQIDNCLVRLNAPEPPGCDGSSLAFVESLLKAGVVSQDSPRKCFVVDQTLMVTEVENIGIAAQPPKTSEYEIGFILDYGDGPIGRQSFQTQITPELFERELAPCRTFVLEAEVKTLQANGIGKRATPQNVLVFGDQGLIENSLRFPNECARHKALDCLGDFALLGCSLVGRFIATQSGHRTNHAMIRKIREQMIQSNAPATIPLPTSCFTPPYQHRAAS
ncbi:UDP-3-O-acyl-N-acetylglucosamine deacetylase [Thalassoglobus sp.]|uniref:UDP-3-O-acyl-N-acetylglucosamine deacetylase n=1 Tax=Thalassoglobus sp. TaxID=2795869 RepID=UPI003AA99A83